MRARRGNRDDRALCSGPGRLTQALGISGADDGLSTMAPPFELEQPKHPVDVVATPRIGITNAAELPWRYLIKGTCWASRGPRSR
jgi:DNA-3-methyladenine glycosylase